MCIKDNRVSNFESKEWMNSKVGLIKVKALVKPQHRDAVNCQASEISPEIYGDSMVTSLSCISGSFPQKRKFRSSCWKGRESNRDIGRKYYDLGYIAIAMFRH